MRRGPFVKKKTLPIEKLNVREERLLILNGLRTPTGSLQPSVDHLCTIKYFERVPYQSSLGVLYRI